MCYPPPREPENEVGSSGEAHLTNVGVSRNSWTPEIYGPPCPNILKYLDRVSSACSRVINCRKNGRPRFVRSWDDTLLTRSHESGL